MAITLNNQKQGNQFEFLGTNSDTKPTTGVGANSLFFELDTGDIYYFTGETWAKVGGAS